jgi:hypothetical protein
VQAAHLLAPARATVVPLPVRGNGLRQTHPYDNSLLIAAARVHDMLNDTAAGAALYKEVCASSVARSVES